MGSSLALFFQQAPVGGKKKKSFAQEEKAGAGLTV